MCLHDIDTSQVPVPQTLKTSRITQGSTEINKILNKMGKKELGLLDTTGAKFHEDSKD